MHDPADDPSAADDPADPSPAVALSPPPERLVEHGAVARFGMFAGDVADPNLAEMRLYGPMGRLRLKQWQHLAIVHPDLALTFAVVDAGIVRLGWVQGVDRRTGARSELARQSPWLDLSVARTLRDDRTWLRARDVQIELHNHLDADRHSVSIRTPEIEADLVCLATATPLVVCLPVGRGRAMYSHKVPLPVEGRIRWQGREIELDPEQTTGIFDIHKAHYPHRTWWKWGTFAGRDETGARVAVNLTRNLIDDPAFHENALWVDGRLSLLPVPTFRIADDPWTAQAEGVSLTFEADGERREDLDLLGLIRSRFRQRYGRWQGDVAGRTLSGAWGLAEDHDSRW